MDKELKNIEIKMKALGLSEQQIQAIIKESLPGRPWSEMNREEKKKVLQALEERILFTRKILKFLNCKTCWK